MKAGTNCDYLPWLDVFKRSSCIKLWNYLALLVMTTLTPVHRNVHTTKVQGVTVTCGTHLLPSSSNQNPSRALLFYLPLCAILKVTTFFFPFLCPSFPFLVHVTVMSCKWKSLFSHFSFPSLFLTSFHFPIISAVYNWYSFMTFLLGMWTGVFFNF